MKSENHQALDLSACGVAYASYMAARVSLTAEIDESTQETEATVAIEDSAIEGLIAGRAATLTQLREKAVVLADLLERDIGENRADRLARSLAGDLQFLISKVS